MTNKQIIKKIRSPKKQRAKLIKKLDEVFNAFIRERDNGKPCISCNKRAELQAGHYHSCRYLSIRWDEKNVNGQCINCNIFNQGNFYGYTLGMERKYGKNVIEYLNIKKNNTTKLSPFELSLLIQEYETKLSYEKTKRGINN